MRGDCGRKNNEMSDFANASVISNNKTLKISSKLSETNKNLNESKKKGSLSV